MTVNRGYRQKRDISEPEIVKALVKAGLQVLRLTTFDLLVLRGEQIYMLDCKTGKGSITEYQAKLIEAGWPLRLVSTPEEALKAVGL